ncbi:MAG: transcriptional regulator BetI, partial [Alphaproteobacteria bacterium]|nr:transcriptional regulator BetI [Alphaproteobacteria bacterium]
RASFSATNFRRDVVGAWLNFYVLALTVPEARRLLAVYQRRLRSNLVAALRPLVGAEAGHVADRIGAMIDGVYLREALGQRAPDGQTAVAQVGAVIADALAASGCRPE